MKYIKRQIEKQVLELSKTWSVILLTGSSQAEKTPMLWVLAKREDAGRKYVSLDDLNAQGVTKSDPNEFLKLHKPSVLIDEVQYAPELYFYDTGLFYLTGLSLSEAAKRGAMSDALIQNFYLSEVMKDDVNVSREPYLRHYRDWSSRKDDVLFEGNGKLFPLKITKSDAQNEPYIQILGAIDNLQPTTIPMERVKSPPSIPMLNQEKQKNKHNHFRAMRNTVKFLLLLRQLQYC